MRSMQAMCSTPASPLVHGTYDMGSNVGATLFAGAAEQATRDLPENWTLQVVAVHQGYAGQGQGGNSTVAAKEGAAATVEVQRCTRDMSHALSDKQARSAAHKEVVADLQQQDAQIAAPPPAPLNTANCGPATQHSGIVVDAWKLPILI